MTPKTADESNLLDQGLPKVARSLCELAMNMIGEEMPKINKQIFLENFGPVLHENFGSLKNADQEGLLEFFKQNKIDPSNPFSYPFDSAEFRQLHPLLGTNDSFQSDRGLSAEQESALKLISLLFFFIMLIFTTEKEYESGQLKSYSEFMKRIDPAITQLHFLIFTGKTVDPILDALKIKLDRKKGGIKGGKKSNPKRQALKDEVLEMASSIYSEGKITKAAPIARAINDHFNEKESRRSTWLCDDQGKPLYADFVGTFTQWIRKAN
jgi:hypothetical protein